MGFGAALVLSLVFFGIWSIKDGIQGNDLRTGAIGAGFVLLGWLLAYSRVLAP